ncbi:MAG: hypothetical protein NVS4B12_02910 [Ktedonobacteraceae bacterium]
MGDFEMATTRGQHLIGTVLGSCVLERLLGYGGSSAVFLGQQHTPDRKVAVKVFLPRSTMDMQMRRDFYRRFLREAEAASQLHHPNILPIYSYGEQDGLPYIIMPYMSGGTLSEYIAKRGPLSLEEAQWHLEQLASALEYAHEHGCVHCDVKPANILLDGTQRIMLADFGIARLISKVPTEEQETATKNNESLMGTPDYISPEQALGQTLDGRSDIYSLGITLFYLLAKQLPFQADTTIALALMHIHEVPPSLCMIRADVSPSIDRVVRKALAKNPEQRFQTASALSTAFIEAIARTRGSTEKEDCIEDPFSQQEVRSIPAKAIVQVKQVSTKPFRRTRFLTMPKLVLTATLLFIIIGITVTSTFYFLHRVSINASQTSLATGIVKQTNTDTLTNEGDWPLSSTFFYDKQHQHYHILNKSDQAFALALYNEHQYSNFHLSVTMMLVHGDHAISDYYGVVFRASADQSHYYLFEIMSSVTGQYSFWRFDGKWQNIASGSVSSLLVGPGKSNTLTIEAHDNAFSFAINKKSVSAPISDTSPAKLSTGEVGLYVEQQNAEVAFSDLYITSPK